MAYYTLVTRDHVGAKWCPKFGDKVRSVVVDEQDDYVDHDYKRCNTKIVQSTTMHQRDIDAAIAKLNGETVEVISNSGHGLSWRAA